VTNRIII